MNLTAEEPFSFSTRNEIPEFLLRETQPKIHLHQIKLCRTWYHVIPVLVQGTPGITGQKQIKETGTKTETAGTMTTIKTAGTTTTTEAAGTMTTTEIAVIATTVDEKKNAKNLT